MNDTPDLSALFSMFSHTNKNPEEILQTILHASANSHEQASSSSQDSVEESSHSIPDMDTMMKFVQLLQTSRQDTPSKELLKSLKPFLKDSRKEKIDYYIQLLGMIKALETFQELGDKPK